MMTWRIDCRDRGMGSDKSISDGTQKIRPLHGITSSPTRRSTKVHWTVEEDEILSQAVQRFKAKNWKKIAECFKDRTDVQCLHRWKIVLNPELVRGPWSKEEDEIIIESVHKYGPKKWSSIAQRLPGRIGKQCRERWHSHLNPSINKEAWTQDEELALIRAHQIYGNRWAKLTKLLPGRTDNSIKNHWNSSVKKKLDSYMASGLLEQFQGFPPVVHQNQSTPSSSLRMQNSGDDNDSGQICGTEAEEISKCSQESTVMARSQSANDLGCSTNILQQNYSHMPCSLPSDGYQINSEGLSNMHLPGLGQGFSGAPTHCIAAHESQEVANVSLQDSMGFRAPGRLEEMSVCSSVPEQVLISDDEFYKILFSKATSGGNIPQNHKEDSNIADFDQCNEFATYPSSNKHRSESEKTSTSQSCHPPRSDLQDTGSLCYEPPRLLSLNLPSLSYDLVQSDHDLQRVYSPLGLQQSSANYTSPLRLWGSPTRTNSAEAVLKRAAKTSIGTPSIMKKRTRDSLSPLSERRKVERLDIGMTSRLRNEFQWLDVFDEAKSCRPNVMFPLSNQKIKQVSYSEDKENVDPFGIHAKDGGKDTGEDFSFDLEDGVNNGNNIQADVDKGISGSCPNTTDHLGPSELPSDGSLDHLLLFSPHAPSRRKCHSRRLLTLSEKVVTSGFPSGSTNTLTSSPTVCKENEGPSVAVAATERVDSPKSTKNTVANNWSNGAAENFNLFSETPYKRSIESPSAWKSPWFINSFIPGERVDTDSSVEDIGYFMSPGERSCDALALMKQFSEHSAAACADALEVLGDEIPKSLTIGRGSKRPNSDFNKVEVERYNGSHLAKLKAESWT